MLGKALLVDVEHGGDILSLYIPQPSFERVKECVDFFGYLFEKSQKRKNILRVAKDLDLIIEKVAKEEDLPNLKTNIDALLQEAILQMKPLNQFDGKDLKEGQELFNSLEDETKAILKAQILFQYALLRYAPRKIAEKDLSEFYTALTFAECKEHFLKCIEEAEKLSLQEKMQEG